MSGSIWPDEPPNAPTPYIPPAREMYEKKIQDARGETQSLLDRLRSITDANDLIRLATKVQLTIDQLGSDAENETEHDLHNNCRMAMVNLTSAVASRIGELDDSLPGKLQGSAYPALNTALQQVAKDLSARKQALDGMNKNFELWQINRDNDSILGFCRSVETYNQTLLEQKALEILSSLSEDAKAQWVRILLQQSNSHILAIGTALFSTSYHKLCSQVACLLANAFQTKNKSVQEKVVNLLKNYYYTEPVSEWKQIESLLIQLIEKDSNQEIRGQAIQCLAWVGGAESKQFLKSINRWFSPYPTELRKLAKYALSVLNLRIR